MASNFSVGVAVTSLVYELFILLVGVLGADLHKGGNGFHDELEDGYHLTWFSSVLVMFVSVIQIVYWTGRCDCTVNRNVNIFLSFCLFLSIVLVIAAASIFTSNYGDQRCGSGDMETTCESEIFFLYASPVPIRAMILYFKMQDLHWVK